MAAAGQPTAASGDQFYVTHCTTADSVSNSPGYGVRAASAADPDSLTHALEYPPYELPLDMWRDKPARPQTPRRLARTPHPVSGVWAAHSVFLDKDTMNRDRSYFTHLLALPSGTDAASVLESWDADGWVKEYPPGAPKALRPMPLPRGDKVTRAALSAFLSDALGGPTDLATVVCPARLRADAGARRSLAGRFLKGLMLATAARDADEARDRLFVHAEPGLTAMLLYAAARILPPAFTADLTFSTFEPAHRSLRDYTLATVVGTYYGLPGMALDPDLVTAHGFGIDCFQPDRSSPELAEGTPFPRGLFELIDLAAAGEWELLEDVHAILGADAGALDRVAAALPVARAEGRLKRGGVTAEDLIAMKRDRRGSAFLERHADKVWGFLKPAAISDARLRAEFKDWIAEPERLKAYRREACEALARGEFDGWDVRLAVIRGAADPAQFKTQIEQAQKNLDKYLPTLPPLARDRLRAACAESGAWPDHHLLAPTSLDELDALLAPTVPPAWQGYTCFAVMGPDEKNWLVEATRPFRPAMRERVRLHLLGSPVPVLAAYATHARDFVSVMPGLLYDLLVPFRPQCVPFLSRLIDAGAGTIEAADWVKLLGELDIYGQRTKDWEGFLLKNDHLAKLLAGFGAAPAATPVWGGYLDLLGPTLLDGDEWETRLYSHLSNARQALGAANIPLKSVAPPEGVRKLKAADTLLAVLANPAAAETFEEGQLHEAFQVFGIDPTEGLRKVYLRCNFPAIDLNRDPAPLRPFAAAFRSCFPVARDYPSARAAVLHWVAISMSCPPPTQAAFQSFLVNESVPPDWQGNLLREQPPIPLHPATLALMAQAVAQHALAQSEQAAQAEAFGTDDDSTPRRRSRSGGNRRVASEEATPRRRRRGGAEGVPGWVWILLVLFGGLLLAGIAASQLKKPATPADPDPIIEKPTPVKAKPKDKTKVKE